MKKNHKFQPGQSGNPATQFKPGNPHRWTSGVSGNPAGSSKYRTRFEEAFNEALITEGSPQEAAKLLWEAARAKEPWAIQALCQRFSPQMQSLQAPQRPVAGGNAEAGGGQGQWAGSGAIIAARDRRVRGGKPERRKGFACCRGQCATGVRQLVC